MVIYGQFYNELRLLCSPLQYADSSLCLTQTDSVINLQPEGLSSPLSFPIYHIWVNYLVDNFILVLVLSLKKIIDILVFFSQTILRCECRK